MAKRSRAGLTWQSADVRFPDITQPTSADEAGMWAKVDYMSSLKQRLLVAAAVCFQLWNVRSNGHKYNYVCSVLLKSTVSTLPFLIQATPSGCSLVDKYCFWCNDFIQTGTCVRNIIRMAYHGHKRFKLCIFRKGWFSKQRLSSQNPSFFHPAICMWEW